MITLSTFQQACIVTVARKANDLAGLALDGHRAGHFDPDAAMLLALEALSCIAAGFDEDVDHAMMQRVIDRCGIAGPMRRPAANDDGFAPVGAA